MSRAEQRLREDRELRDAARANLMADIEHLRTSFSAKGLAGRVGNRIGDGAADVYEIAKDRADDNRGLIAVLIGAIALWLGRGPILEILGLSDSAEAADNEIEASNKDIESDEVDENVSNDQTAPEPGDNNDER